MCSPSVGSGTSWAQCASGSVNENGCAVCACVRATVVQWHVTVVLGGGGVGERMQEEEVGLRVTVAAVGLTPAAKPPRLKLYDKPSRINTRCSISLSLPLLLALCQPGRVCLS